LAVGLALSSVTSAPASAENVPTQVIPEVPPRIVAIDGRLDDAAWADVPVFSPFLIAGTETPAPIRTEIRGCFTRDALLLGAVCHDPDTSRLKANCRSHDDPVFQDDSVEIFVNPLDRTFLPSVTG
jgi:hypothetical protein